MTTLAPDAPRPAPNENGFRRRARKSVVEFSRGFVNLRFVQFSMAFAVLTYADFFNLSGVSSGGIGAQGKYAYFACIAFAFVNAAIHSSKVLIGWNASTIFLGFTAVALVPFLFQLVTVGDTNSYATAFVASLAFSIAIFYGREWKPEYAEALRARLTIWLFMLGALYVGELLVRRFSGISYFDLVLNQFNHLKSSVFVIGIAIALLTGNRSWVAMGVLLAAASLVLRPSSSLIIALFIFLPIAWLIKNKLFALAEMGAAVVILIAAVTPFALQFSPGLSELAQASEVYIKTDALGGTSNTATRLAIMDVAFRRVADSSWLIGEAFTGGTAVQVADVLPFWRLNYASGLAQIHTDYVCVLMESGILGYIFFSLALFVFSRGCFRFLRRSTDAAQTAIVSAGVIAMLCLILYASANPLLQSYQAVAPIWFVMFCAEVIVLSQYRAERPVRRIDVSRAR